MKSKKLKGVIYAFLPILICFLILMFAVGGIFSTGGRYLPERDLGYSITAYDIKINVNENGVYNITETIDADLSYASHGIVRYLPTFQTVKYHKNGKLVKRNYSPKIKNFTYISANSTFGTDLQETAQEGGYRFFYMGTAGYTTGSYRYSFSYDVETGDDRDKSLDMFYFNIIGTGWDTDIDNVTFEITFPTNVTNDFQFYLGQYGQSSEDSASVTRVVSGNKVTGSCAHLDYGEAITCYKEFENGYFKYKKTYLFDILCAVGILIVCGFAAVIFVTKRDKSPVVEVVEFVPPEKLTPTEAGYLNDGEVTGDDLSALIVYWASKGYVKIVDKEENHKKILVQKLAELPADAKEHEKILFRDLFSGGESFDANNVSCNYDTGYKCKTSVERNLSFAFDYKNKNMFSALVGFVNFAVFAVLIKNAVAQSWNGIMLICMFALGLVFSAGMAIYPTIMDYRFKHSKGKHLAFVTLSLVLIFVPLIVFAVLTEAYVDGFLLRFLVFILPIAALLIYPHLQTYTKEGKTVLGRVRGLKRYIEVAEKDKLKMLVKENPNLFYEVLPFAYVLGVTDVYMKKFEDIPIIKPDWYETNNFSFFYIVHLNSNMHMMSRSIRVTPFKPSSGGGFHIGGGSGGGFSGGGFGGGGGGRW